MKGCRMEIIKLSEDQKRLNERKVHLKNLKILFSSIHNSSENNSARAKLIRAKSQRVSSLNKQIKKSIAEFKKEDYDNSFESCHESQDSSESHDKVEKYVSQADSSLRYKVLLKSQTQNFNKPVFLIASLATGSVRHATILKQVAQFFFIKSLMF